MRQTVFAMIALSLSAAPAFAQPVSAPPPPGMTPAPAASQESSGLTFQLGLGYLNEGDVHVEDAEVTMDGGPLVTVGVDSLVAPRLSVGLFAVYAKTEVAGFGINIATVGGTIKTRLGSLTGTHVRLGAAIGYQRITAEDEDPIQGFDVAPVAELVFPSNGKVGFALQLSALSQPAGGNDDAEVTFAPIPYVAAILEIR